jgi:hypothetical protein
MIDRKIWDDQAQFNAELRPIPDTYVGQVELTKEFALHMTTEIAEMLEACGVWEMHRTRHQDGFNPENVRRQLIDQFKYWMSIAQVWGFTPEEMERSYWRKSASVRQRYAEEHIYQLGNRPIVVLDIDNVLCDYTRGFGAWLGERLETMRLEPLTQHAALEALRHAILAREYLGPGTLGLDNDTWLTIQHEFRLSGGFAHLPPMPNARQFVEAQVDDGCVIVALTSRPIDEYPNLRDDTVEWFRTHHIPVDYIWWGVDKAEKLTKNLAALAPNIRFAVDDDVRFLRQYERMGVRQVYWLRQGYGEFDSSTGNTTAIYSLLDIKEKS